MDRAKFIEVFKLSAPLSAAQFAQSAMIFSDTVLFGLLGVTELAGGGLGAGVYHFFVIVITGIFSALSAEVAILAGKENTDGIARVFKAGLVMALLLALLLGFLLQFGEPFLAFAEQPEAALDFADAYLSGAVWISFPAFLFLALRGLAVGMGYTTGIMRISFLAILINVPVSYVLMTGWGGLPELGVFGVAMGTVVGSSFMCVMLLRDLWNKSDIRTLLQKIPILELRRQDFSAFWLLGVPIALAWTMEAGVFTAATLLAGTISVAALAAHQIALQTASMAFNIYIGFAQGAAIRTGQSYGQGDYLKVRQYTWTGLVLGFAFCIGAALLFVLLPEPIIRLFTLGAQGTLDREVQQLGVGLLMIAALFQLVDGGQVIMMTALRGLRVGMPPTLVSIVSYWVVGFPIAWALMGPFGVLGIWAGLGLGLGFAFVCLVVMFIRKVRQLEMRENLSAVV